MSDPNGTPPQGVDPTTDDELQTAQQLDVPDAHRIDDTDDDDVIKDKLRRQGVRIGAGGIAPRVFWPSMLVILAIAVLAIVQPEAMGAALEGLNGWIVSTFGWYYMLAIAVFIASALFFGLSRYGRIRLGDDDEEPEFGVLSWFAMLFAAGMGIGLVFYGVGEPLLYSTTDPKPGWPDDPDQQATLAMAQTFVHWGLHPWAIYSVIGLALAYAIHRRGRPISIRWALEPLLGDRVKGWAGDLIDVLAIFGTVFGIATSLGLGVQQIASGMVAMGVIGGVETTVLVVLILVITFLAILSVASGLGKGIKWLSNINLSMAGLLLVSVLALGPTVFLMQNFVQSLGAYLANVMGMTFDSAAFTGEDGSTWNSTWTIFYWGWWISWAPFVGVFVARISRGRTIREFVAGVLLVPSIVGFFWFSVMGGAGIFRQMFSDDPLVGEDGEVAVEAALFDVLAALPLGGVLSVIAIIVVAIFFITSSDSGSLVVDMLASGGHPNPPLWSRVLWSLLEGLIAIGLLIAGGLEALQAAALATALPFSIILLLMCASTLRALRVDAATVVEDERRQRYAALSAELRENFDEHFGEKVDDRIDYRLSSSYASRRRPGGGRDTGVGG